MARIDRILNRSLAVAAACLLLSACAGTSPLDDLADATPTGPAFTQQLFKNYAFLANSFAAAPSSGSFDTEGMATIFDGGGNPLAEAFATKALIAAKGVDPEPEPSMDSESASARARLIRDLETTKQRFAVDAARAQTDYDCWMLNGTVDSQQRAARQCRASFANTILRLEHDMRPVAAAAPAPMAVAAPAPGYAVYFGFDEWTLTAEAMATITSTIDSARTGRQSHIAIVGHTDTAGATDYNEKLSVKRADVVRDVMVQMGARPA